MNYINRKFHHLSDLIDFIFHIFRYFSFFKINYNVNSDIKFRHKEQNKFFYNKLKKSKLFLEFGSGTTTLLAQKLNKNFISIESDKQFYIYLKKKILSLSNKNVKNKVNYLLKPFGITGFYSRIHFIKWKKYNKNFQNKITRYCSDIFYNLREIPDLILVDGRYRLLCLVYLYEFLKKKKFKTKTTIILDDFSIRKKKYNSIERLYNIKIYYDFALLKPKTKLKNVRLIIDQMKKINIINPS